APSAPQGDGHRDALERLGRDQLVGDGCHRGGRIRRIRIAVSSVDVEPDPSDSTAAVATITYKLVATQTLERVSVTVTLGG
ncbi:MAG TPA: hypothetical protein VF469_13860, partial [Kofleriaceae bacterium]